MIRGVSIQVSQMMEDSILWAILKNVHVEKYRWYNFIEENEIWTDSVERNLFERSDYEGEDFLEEIQLKQYIIFLKLQAYNQQTVVYNIHNYEEFIKSECQMMVLVYDGEFIEIYAKDMKAISIIYEDAIKNKCRNVEYITDDNDMRSQMDVIG